MNSMLKSISRLHSRVMTDRSLLRLSSIVESKINRKISCGVVAHQSAETLGQLGQPTFVSHPHLLREGEINPGIQLEELVKRRERLVSSIIEDTKGEIGHVIIIPAATTLYMTRKIPYVFRQDNDFRYFSGCLEPDTVLALVISSKDSYKSVLFTREKNKHTELWEGLRTGSKEAVEYFGVDEAYPMTEFSPVIMSKMKDLDSFKLWFNNLECRQPGVTKMVMAAASEAKPKEVEAPTRLIHRLRVVKSIAELKLMARAAEIVSRSAEEGMRVCTRATKAEGTCATEHQLWAVVDAACRLRGATMLAYPPVIAAGNNANTIHYIANTQAVHSDDMVLMDVGSDFGGYCSDMSRTWPARGKFSEHEKALYNAVLTVQKDLIKALGQGRPCLDDLLAQSTDHLGRVLAEAGVLSDEALQLTPAQVGVKFCPHHVSHFLGMDVHDTPTISRQTPLEEGMVVTIEPGVYIDKTNTLAKPEFRGIGIRIEDDVVVTNSNPVVLTSTPKTVSELEELLNR